MKPDSCVFGMDIVLAVVIVIVYVSGCVAGDREGGVGGGNGDSGSVLDAVGK